MPFIVTTAEYVFRVLNCIDSLPTDWVQTAWKTACDSQVVTVVISLVPFPQLSVWYNALTVTLAAIVDIKVYNLHKLRGESVNVTVFDKK